MYLKLLQERTADSAQEVWNVCKSEVLMHFSCMYQYMFKLWTVLSAKKLEEEVSTNKRKLS